MKRKLSALALACLCATSFAQQQNISFDQKLSSGLLSFYLSTYSLSAGALTTNFGVAAYPGFTVKNATPEDLRGWDALLVEVTNFESDPIQIFLRVDDSPTANGLLNCRTGFTNIAAGTTTTVAFPLRLNPSDYGMKALPGLFGSEWLSMNNGVINLGNIVQWKVFIQNPNGPVRRLKFANARYVVGTSNLNQMVDEMGQYRYATWAGKAANVSDMLVQDNVERVDLITNPSIPGYDAKGAWLTGPPQVPTGRFRTSKINNKWWFVSPEGRLFLSFGMATTGAVHETYTQNREYMFNWLPTTGDPLYQFVGNRNGQTTLQFYQSNLFRKFGASWFQDSRDRAFARLKSWGFNTMGSWTEPQYWRSQQVPYTVQVDISGSHKTLLVDPGRKALGDPFDPAFRTSVRQCVSGIIPSAIGDPWCIGWFVDNEPNFAGPTSTEEAGRYGICYAAMKGTLSSPAKLALIQQLKGKYSSITALNTAWGTSYASWATLESPITLVEPSSVSRKADFQEFCLRYIRLYFQVLKESMREADPAAMYLGCRFFRYTTEALQAADSYCTVVSFNSYSTGIGASWNALSWMQKPFMITEFHFGSLDSGMFHPGLQQVPTQIDRGVAYENYVRSVVDHPQFVGCHWFQYLDEPITGRYHDGGNYNCGFVSAVDVPYPALVKAARSIHTLGYARRYYGP